MVRLPVGLSVILFVSACGTSSGGGGGTFYPVKDTVSATDSVTGGATDTLSGADSAVADTGTLAGDAAGGGDVSVEGLCLMNACKTEFTACSANALCKTAIQCIGNCAPTDQACYTQCGAAIGSDATAQVVTNALLTCMQKAAPGCGGTAKLCGNGKCDAGETTGNCPADCPAPTTCGPYVKPTVDPGCSGAADKSFINGLQADAAQAGKFADQVRECTLTKGCMAKGSDCTTEAGKLALQGQCIAQCVAQNLDPSIGTVSENCAWCYGAYSGACGFNHCLAECATDTPDCNPCLAANCDPFADACKAGQ